MTTGGEAFYVVSLRTPVGGEKSLRRHNKVCVSLGKRYSLFHRPGSQQERNRDFSLALEMTTGGEAFYVVSLRGARKGDVAI